MAGLKHTTILNSQRPVITRPPPVIVPPTQLNLSTDAALLTDSFFSPNNSFDSSKVHGVRHSVLTEQFYENENFHRLAQDRHAYDYHVQRCAHRGNCATQMNGSAVVGSRYYPYRPTLNYGTLADTSPHLFNSPPLSPFGDATPFLGCAVIEDSLRNQPSKGHWCSEINKVPKGNVQPGSRAEPMFRSGMKFVTASPITIVTPHLPCGATVSMNSSLSSSDSLSEADSSKRFSCVSENCYTATGSYSVESPTLPLPPAAYADSEEEPYICTDRIASYSQNSDDVVSDFFSQSEHSSCSNSSEESSPQAREVACYTQNSNGHASEFLSQSGISCIANSSEEDLQNVDSNSRQDDDIGNLSLSSEVHPTVDDLAVQRKIDDISDEGSPQTSVVASSVSSTCSPAAKRGRFSSSCKEESSSNNRTLARESRLLNVERYHNEYARDTYAWLSYREATAHGLGTLFMDAQKKEGASWTDRRAVIMRALMDMKKRKHSLEAIHLGAYILDKCLDSFHIAKSSLADVCAVSMTLGTKMEEYDSLRPGNVDGLCDATADKARLCDIEKRIVHEMKDGLCFPTPLLFAHYMLAELCCDDEQIRFAQYLLELALLDSQFRDEGGPRLAHAVVCMSFAIAKQRDSIFVSECDTLVEAEEKLFELTKLPVGSTRDVMRKLVYEMDRAVREKHSILIDYLSEDNKRVCFCEVSPPFWNLLCGVCQYSYSLH